MNLLSTHHALAVCIAVLPLQAAHAETLDWAAPLAGGWTLSGVQEGDPWCGVKLGAEGAIGGAAIEISATCQRNFPLEEVAAWTIAGEDLVLINAMRQEVIRFEQRGEFFSATMADGRVVALDEGLPEPPATPEALFDGTFTLSGPNNSAPCGFFASAASENEGTLEQAGQCAAPWHGKGWRRWRLAEGQLQLIDGESRILLSLAPGDGFTFVTEWDGQPVFFGPGVIIDE